MESSAGIEPKRFVEATDEYEPGLIRDLIKDAPNRYATVEPKTLRVVIDHDTMYLGKMDLTQLRLPAKEAAVKIAPGEDPEKVRKGIRDKIQAAAAK